MLIQADLKTTGMMFSQLSEELEEVEKEGREEKKVTSEVELEAALDLCIFVFFTSFFQGWGEEKMIREVEFEAELDAEVSNWTSFPASLAVSTQTLGLFVPRSRTSTPTFSLLQPNHLWTYSPTLAQV